MGLLPAKFAFRLVRPHRNIRYNHQRAEAVSNFSREHLNETSNKQIEQVSLADLSPLAPSPDMLDHASLRW